MRKVFRDISYGMYFLTSSYNDKKSGCVVNTFSQVNSVDNLVSISLNKDNYTSKIIKDRKLFGISIISNDTSKDAIGKFGYYSSCDVDKYNDINYKLVDDIPVVMENVCSYVIVSVVDIIDCNTHDIIIGKVIKGDKVSDKIPMTYKYYHEKLKGVSPKNAPTYVEDTDSNNGSKYRCKICGYIYDDSIEKISFEDLPDDWRCPLCGASKEMFEKI